MKSTISKKTTRINQLVKHYNQLSTHLDSLKVEDYKPSVGAFKAAILEISDKMENIALQINECKKETV